MGALLPLIFLAAVVKTDHTPLQDGCGEDSSRIAVLSAGVPVTIRFAVAGEVRPCYKVSATVDGKVSEGYLPDTAIDGLEEFDQGRRDAAWLDASQMLGALTAPSKIAGVNLKGEGVAREAARLIEASQPGRALQLLEPELVKRRDPSLLALAGIAAWRADDPRAALRYWQGSIELQPNPDLERLLHRVEREVEADQGVDKVYGMRITLRYDAGAIQTDIAREMVSVLDQEFGRVSSQLGCVAEERVIAIAQTGEAYRKATNAAEWSGGQYDGRIRVPLLGQAKVGPELRRVLAHEITHACLSMLGRWPAWLQEGLAQKLSGEVLLPVQRQKIAAMVREGKLPHLTNLGQDWSRMDGQRASLAYALALAAVEILYENYHEWGVRSLVQSPERLAAVTADLDKRLGL